MGTRKQSQRKHSKAIQAQIELETAIAEAIRLFERTVPNRRVLSIHIDRYDGGSDFQIEALTIPR
jgi:hypothetical protein